MADRIRTQRESLASPQHLYDHLNIAAARRLLAAGLMPWKSWTT
ncbi:hypothetical protein OG607_32850 [Streptomyces sp. NBC_01537]